jgi:UDP-N-acetylmuramoyl-L-alanyl-D-glutamate--2,6-diaminopimelate ligase
MSRIAIWVNDNAQDSLVRYAITGTNGKTTIVYVIESILNLMQRKAGIMGTAQNRAGDLNLTSWLTTPESPDIQAIIAKMKNAKITDLAMEVSSHALEDNRVYGMHYDVAGFTNLSHDHLDYHKNIDAYFNSKAKLFTPEHAKCGVVNIDDEFGQRIADSSEIECVTLGEDADKDPDYLIENIVYSSESRGFLDESESSYSNTFKSSFYLTQKEGKRLFVATNLLGDFNKFNVSMAIVMVSQVLGFENVASVLSEEIGSKGVFSVEVPGRMQIVAPKAGQVVVQGEQGVEGVPTPTAQGATQVSTKGKNNKRNQKFPTVIVDYAHNPSALRNLLEAAENLLETAGAPSKGQDATPSRVILVFGAPGKRDVEKRPIMGEIAVELADVVFVTDDEPHNDDPSEIRADIIKGMPTNIISQLGDTCDDDIVTVNATFDSATPDFESEDFEGDDFEDDSADVLASAVYEVSPRKTAIEEAILMSSASDVVLLAGRGHETTQEIDGKIIELDDRKVALSALEEWIDKHND